MGLKIFLVVFLAIAFSQFVNADIFSINSGGDSNIVISPDTYTEGFFFRNLICGDGIIDTGEQCDDGGTANGDGCSSTCQNEVSDTGTPGGSTGGGGGGGAGVTTVPFSVLRAIPNSFNIPATAGIEDAGKISLSNLGEESLSIVISLTNLYGILLFEETVFSLSGYETKTLPFLIIPPNEPGIYAGKIVFTSGSRKLEVPFALNVGSELSLFDISVDLSETNKRIREGNVLTSQITLIQAGLQEKQDVVMEYVIKDFDGNIYLTESETLAVLKEKSYEKIFDSTSLPIGDYLLGAEVIYSGGIATASAQFSVYSPEIKAPNFIIVIELLAAILILIVLIIIAKNYKRK
ncbi:MAG: myxococcus cysteine-rich repeat containing protein [archaeon]